MKAKNKTPKNGKSDSKQVSAKPRFNLIKWLLVAVLIAAGVGANYYFISQPVSLRLIGWLVLICIVAGISITTRQGQQVRAFASDSNVELRKVVWPTRQETVQTTMVVIALVLLLGLILWGIDTLLIWAVGMIAR